MIRIDLRRHRVKAIRLHPRKQRHASRLPSRNRRDRRLIHRRLPIHRDAHVHIVCLRFPKILHPHIQPHRHIHRHDAPIQLQRSDAQILLLRPSHKQQMRPHLAMVIFQHAPNFLHSAPSTRLSIGDHINFLAQFRPAIEDLHRRLNPAQQIRPPIKYGRFLDLLRRQRQVISRLGNQFVHHIAAKQHRHRRPRRHRLDHLIRGALGRLKFRLHPIRLRHRV